MRPDYPYKFRIKATRTCDIQFCKETVSWLRFNIRLIISYYHFQVGNGAAIAFPPVAIAGMGGGQESNQRFIALPGGAIACNEGAIAGNYFFIAGFGSSSAGNDGEKEGNDGIQAKQFILS